MQSPEYHTINLKESDLKIQDCRQMILSKKLQTKNMKK